MEIRKKIFFIKIKIYYLFIFNFSSLPGRTCAALLCDLCNQHGDCIPDPITNNITCACTEGFSGEFCEVAPSSLPFILFIILAILFLLLALW